MESNIDNDDIEGPVKKSGKSKKNESRLSKSKNDDKKSKLDKDPEKSKMELGKSNMGKSDIKGRKSNFGKDVKTSDKQTRNAKGIIRFIKLS